ncbi:PREDICTED: nuclear transcription factor Y subunit gamma-like isoform X2 [Nicotiana attenuata]|uniref:Nuclear transcription factor y subunit c-4 n=1 Tax=Nicotiana attenuata TaxID=49451 RepID=A0A1J6JSV0_NICAT|nr:PREDICTED: nuclear transcription factor Y subunit gamma-like isoform X2 [Nicotiana attenuata]OIT19588.1 nuclear transcription factor y subunit c-4 [Nicotiana attenuata]
MEFPKPSSVLSSEMQKPVGIHSCLPSNNKTQQDEDKREPCFLHLLRAKLLCFWKQQVEEILQASELKRKQELPLARIRRVIKSNDQVKMVSAHSIVLFAKATEMFILELTLRAWMQAELVKRRTLKRYDIARAIRNEELLDFLCDIVPLQSYKFQVEEANYGQGNEFHPAYQMVQPINFSYQFQVEKEANDGQGNEFHPAYEMLQLQPNNIPYQFQVEEEALDVQGNEFHQAYQMVQPNNIPQQNQFQVEELANDGQGNEFLAAYQMVQPNDVPYQFQVEEEANGGQGNQFHPAYEMVQPNNIPASFTSIQGIPAPLMLPPAINSSAEAEFTSGGFALDNEEGL